jgi:hypothetical protein
MWVDNINVHKISTKWLSEGSHGAKNGFGIAFEEPGVVLPSLFLLGLVTPIW